MFSIVGIGVDIERVERFAHFVNGRNDPFLQRVFTVGELAYCFGQASPAEHLAGRFAAKEAVIKALTNFTNDPVAQSDIEIARNEKGAPIVRLKSGLLPPPNIQISISHTSETAMAFVIVMSNG